MFPGEDESRAGEKETKRRRTGRMMSWGKERERLHIAPGLASSRFITSHKKLSSLIVSTMDIIILPAEVI